MAWCVRPPASVPLPRRAEKERLPRRCPPSRIVAWCPCTYPPGWMARWTEPDSRISESTAANGQQPSDCCCVSRTRPYGLVHQAIQPRCLRPAEPKRNVCHADARRAALSLGAPVRIRQAGWPDRLGHMAIRESTAANAKQLFGRCCAAEQTVRPRLDIGGGGIYNQGRATPRRPELPPSSRCRKCSPHSPPPTGR